MSEIPSGIVNSVHEINVSGPRLLEVTIIEARNLLNMSKVEGEITCDSYVTVNMIDLGQREIESENFRTSVKHETLSPNWEEETFQIGKNFSLKNEKDLPTLKFVVYHKPTFAVAEVPLGIVTYEIDSIDEDGAEFVSWLPLGSIGRLKTTTGELHVKIKFSSPPEFKERSVSQSGYNDYEKLEYEKNPPNQLLVKIIRAKHLGSSRKIGFYNSTDPQVRI
jgi:hypothetical protein